MNYRLNHHRDLLYALCGAVLWMLSISHSLVLAQDKGDPNAIWYQAFITFKSAEDLEAKGQYLEALNRCNEAKQLYDGLAYGFPEFQPEIVKYKRQKCADTRLRIKAANEQKMNPGPKNSRPNNNFPPPRPEPELLNPNRENVPNFNSNPSLPNRGAGGGVEREPKFSPSAPIEDPKHGRLVFPSPYSKYLGEGSTGIVNDARKYQASRDAEIERYARKNRELEIRQRQSEDVIRQKNLEIKRKQQKIDSLRLQMRSDPSRMGEVQLLLDKSMEVNRQLTGQVEYLTGELQRANKQIKIYQAQVEKLTKERDSLVRIIQGKGIGSEVLQDLMEQNKRLEQRLDFVEKVAQRASEDNRRKDQDIKDLKTEIEKVKIERDTLVHENVKHQVEIDSLNQKLELLSKGLSEEQRENLNRDPEQRAENQMLRSMVLKQLRHQAHQKQAKELLLRQLDRVGNRSTVLLQLVEDMTRGPQLTPEEMAQFKSPQFAELLDAAYDGDFAQVKGAEDKEYLFSPSTVEQEPSSKVSNPSPKLVRLDETARLHFKEGRLAEAERGFLEFLHLQPRSVPCLCNLGVLKLSLKNYSEAQSYLQKAIAIDRKSGSAHYLLGRTYFLQNNLDEAMTHLEQSLQIDPKNAKAHNCVGVIASQKGWVTRARKAFEKAVGIHPNYGDAHFNLAVLFSSGTQTDPGKVQLHYFKALEIYRNQKFDPETIRDRSIEEFLARHGAAVELGAR